MKEQLGAREKYQVRNCVCLGHSTIFFFFFKQANKQEIFLVVFVAWKNKIKINTQTIHQHSKVKQHIQWPQNFLFLLWFCMILDKNSRRCAFGWRKRKVRTTWAREHQRKEEKNKNKNRKKLEPGHRKWQHYFDFTFQR